MKKKVFAALCAGAMLCGMVSAPVSAEETQYRKGDVNMNGEIDLRDCHEILIEYTYYTVSAMDHYLTDEQIELADVLPDTSTRTLVNRWTGTSREINSRITARDVILLLRYYTYAMVDPELREKDIVEWVKESNPQLWAKYEK